MALEVGKEASIVPLDRLGTKPYNLIVSYPYPTIESVESRVGQLKVLGVEALVFSGRLTIDGVPVLGKGCVGMVLEAVRGDGERIAVKIRRTDADRPNMAREAEMLKIANGLGVGPEYRGETEDVLAMQIVDGRTLPFWLPELHGRGRKRRVKSIVHLLMEQCYALDHGGLDHGELSHAHKNVLVQDETPFIVDFESASLKRRPSNLTSLTQYLFIAGKLSRGIRRILGFKDDGKELVGALRLYKEQGSKESFERVLSVLRL